MATTRSSTRYAADLLGNLKDSRDKGGFTFPIGFSVTILSTAATGDIYNLFMFPAYARCIGLFCTTNGIGVSAGANITAKIGDAGDTSRIMLATDFDVTSAQGYMAYAATIWAPTVDTLVYLTIVGSPVVGKIINGTLLCIQAG